MIGTWTPWAGLVLFVLVLANQAGVPIPATPSLLAAGALAAGGRLSFGVILATAVAAALSADLVWYGLGRWRGAQTLAVLRRRVKPRAWIDWVESLFLAHRFGTAVWRPILAGDESSRSRAGRRQRSGARTLLLSASGSALVWAGAWAGAGYLFTAATAILHMSR